MCSIQECVCHLLSSQWLKKTFPGVVFAKSRLPEKRYKIRLSEEEISELPEESTNMFKCMDCPDGSLHGDKYSVIEFFSHAEFLGYFYVTSTNTNENDWKMKIGLIPRTERLYNGQKS